MTSSTIPHPPIVSRDEWLAERKKLLAAEKELTKHYDRVNAEVLHHDKYGELTRGSDFCCP